MATTPRNTDQPATESALAVVSMFAVGLGILSFALFPFLIPGIAILALFALPLLPLMLVAALLAPVVLGARALARRFSRRERPGRAPGAASQGDRLPDRRYLT